VGTRILGLSGHRGAGKNTAARAIIDALPYGMTSELPFAAALKDVVRRCFIPADWPLATADLSEEINKAAMLPCGKTVRQVLQMVGTDWFRDLWPDAWINAWKVALAHQHTPYVLYVLVPDVRFPNELEAIQDMGGHVVRLLRTPYPGDRHASEVALDTAAYLTQKCSAQGGVVRGCFNAIIDNRAMSIADSRSAVLSVVHEKGWLR
jgi:hypothetical protein